MFWFSQRRMCIVSLPAGIDKDSQLSHTARLCTIDVSCSLNLEPTCSAAKGDVPFFPGRCDDPYNYMMLALNLYYVNVIHVCCVLCLQLCTHVCVCVRERTCLSTYICAMFRSRERNSSLMPLKLMTLCVAQGIQTMRIYT